MIATYRHALPQRENRFFLTDGGLETTLIFEEKVDLPEFCAFSILGNKEGRALLSKYLLSYAEIALRYDTPMILNTATWRASRDWGKKLGFAEKDLAEANREAVRLIEELRVHYDRPGKPLVIGGCIGPRGDGYIPDDSVTARDSKEYHREQIETFAQTAVDFITAMTLNETPEAIGIVQAARDAKMPVVLSFTLETDGKLPTGQSLSSAIEEVERSTNGYASYYMINCVHPLHLQFTTQGSDPWVQRIRGLRPNASRMSHAELNGCNHLDNGNPEELAEQYYRVKKDLLPRLNIMGGCCGTDPRHIEAITRKCLPFFV